MSHSLWARFFHYSEELYKLYTSNKYKERTGRRLLTWEKIEGRLSICKTCDEFNGKKCALCGCCGGSTESHFNFIAFPTKICPKKPPEWKEEI
jgi:hypothetical protein